MKNDGDATPPPGIKTKNSRLGETVEVNPSLASFLVVTREDIYREKKVRKMG